ncbi:hypothetical protein PAXRUDRAFT_155851, partial [Paxillus rubicundulus Ve08.2h10]
VDNNFASENEVVENIIHKSLESGRGVGKPKEHYEGFKEAVICAKRCLPFIPILYSHIVVTPMYIKFCEVLSPFELVDKILVFHGNRIESSIILNWPKFSVFLFDKEKGRSKW